MGFTKPTNEVAGADFPHENADSAKNELIDYDQLHGYWPPAHPLPLPRWAVQPVNPYKLKNLLDFERLAGKIELELQKLMQEHNYDTVGNFLELYQSFKKSKARSAIEFFHKYNPKITAEHHTCVGLALELRQRLHKLEDQFPYLKNHLAIVSCEEDIVSVKKYSTLKETFDTEPSTLEKEHCLLALRFEFSGRHGVLLCDPGYHVARVVTVMSDKLYPHTGWFVQSEENDVRKEYNYHFPSSTEGFVQWDERTTKGGKETDFTGLIYVERPYLTAVDVTERRNLVYPFRSVLSRDPKGRLIAGVYFKVKPKNDEFTIFYKDSKNRVKMNFTAFMEPEINPDFLNKLSICNEQLNFKEGKLLKMIQTAGELLQNDHYLREILAIENLINVMSENN